MQQHTAMNEHDPMAVPGGLVVSQQGYTLQLDTSILEPGLGVIRFRIIGPEAKPVTEYQVSHDQELHFMAVRRDTTGFQHVHPVRDNDGTWSAELDLTPGDWRFFTDFQPQGHPAMTLGIDAAVPGQYTPHPVRDVVKVSQIDDYTITLKGNLLAEVMTDMVISVSKAGQPVTDLEPYLAAYGHLVCLRVGDLAYLHVRPTGEPGDGITQPGPEIAFMLTPPSPGIYRMYLDFKHQGKVRTADFTVEAQDTLETELTR